MTPTVSVVIPHYWSVREPNLRPIIGALFGGTHPPVEVLIWNNDVDSGQDLLDFQMSVLGHDEIRVIDSPKNYGAQARFLAALMAEGDYILFQDNDLSVERDTIGNLLDWITRDVTPVDRVVTLEGVVRKPGCLYRKWPKRYGRGLLEACGVDISLGRVEMIKRSLLPRALAAYPFEPSTVMDDLYFSKSLYRAGIPIYAIPSVSGASDFIEFPRRNAGLATGPDRASYYLQRDEIAAALFA